MTKLRIAIHGAAGRMGRRLVVLAMADHQLELVAALESAEHPQLGQDAGLVAGAAETGVMLSSTVKESVDAMIDFSVPAAVESIAEKCVSAELPLVVATTGLDERQKTMLSEAAATIPLVWAPNMSLAVNLTMKLAELCARALRDHPGGADVEIIERHHRYKEDAPSGTALRFGEIIADVLGQTQHVHGRKGRPGIRSQSEIAYHALRVGDNTGEHSIVFGLLGESIELQVTSTNRDCYAQGALTAAKFVAGQQPGLYGMNDVLGL